MKSTRRGITDIPLNTFLTIKNGPDPGGKFLIMSILLQQFSKSAKPDSANLITMETPRLILREHTTADVQRMHEIAQTPGFVYYCLDGTQQKAEDFIQEAIRTQTPDATTGRRENHMLAIVMKDTGEVIGHTCLETVPYVEEAPYEVNFFVDPIYQSKGYGLEAILNIMHYGFQKYDLKALMATTHPNNGPSRHLIIKEGYIQIANIDMDTVNGKEPRHLFILARETFYDKRSNDKRPILLPEPFAVTSAAPPTPAP